MQEYDVVIIGAGHNGLVCAAYLLKAGYSVLLLEKRSVPGGAATTEECLPKEAPGFKFNLCAIDHEFIHLGPVVEELELKKYGLEYLECDPVVFCPHPDGKYFLAHKSLEKTCAEIARYSERDAKKYAEFTDYWQRAIGAMIPMFNAPPKSIIDIVGNYDITKLKDLFSVIGSPNKSLDFVRTMLTSAEDLLNEWFDSEFVKAPLARLASELGAPPSQKTIGIGAIMMAMRHNPGMARPRGGTGALVQALVNLVTSKGGEILTDQHVEKVLIDDGKAVGVRVAGGTEYRAKYGVISNIDAKRLFLQMTEKSDVDAADPDKIEASRNELHSLLDKPQLAGIPVLVLGNKRDKPNALDENGLIERMNLSAIQDREICCYSISCKEKDNIDITLQWLIAHSKSGMH